MSIKRSTPEVGYLDPAFLDSAGVSQTVRVKDNVYFSGIVAARGDGTCVAPNDLGAQITFILGVLKKCLAAEGLTFRNVVTTTVYCKDIQALRTQGHLLAAAFREHPPTSTWVQVGSFTDPDYLIEIVATAADG